MKTKDFLKRLSIAAPFVVGAGLIRSWAGFEESKLTGFMVGFMVGIAAYFIADWLLLRTQEQNRFKNVVKLIKENLFTIVKYSALVSIIVFFFGTHERPSDADAALIQQLVEIFGLLLLLMYPIMGFLRVIASGDYHSMMPSVKKSIKVMAVYSLVIWLIGQFGTDF